MAMGKAIVSTTIGAEGLDLTDGSEIILADQPRNFADSVVRLMQSPGERRSIEVNAAAVARKRDWENAAALFQDLLARLLVGSSAGSHAEPSTGERVVSRQLDLMTRGSGNAR